MTEFESPLNCTIYIYIYIYISVTNDDLVSRVCHPLCRQIAEMERKKGDPYSTPPLSLSQPVNAILRWEKTLQPNGPALDLIPLSKRLDVSIPICNTLTTMMTYWLREEIIKSTNNEMLKFICKSIAFFVSFWQIHR